MENKRTCLYDKHVALGALISPFGGFDMPIQYTNIVEEHNAVRKACGELTPLARGGAPANEIAFLTETMTEAQLKQKLAGVEVLSLIRVLA